MAHFKMAPLLLCILLIGQSVNAVVTKPSSENVSSVNEEPKKEESADDRIGDTYGPPPPSSEYGAPASFNGPAPVYGPPEITGDHTAPQVFPPPPPESPPPVYGPPALTYGPPRKPKPQYLPPKPVYGPPPSLPPKANYGPPKPTYGPPKPVYGPPKSTYGPPPTSFTSFRPPKPHYGPPLNFNSPPGPTYGPPAGTFGPPAPTYGPPAPAYGPPAPTYGPPAPQYGPPAFQHGPPAPTYGPPAAQNGPPAPTYGPPAAQHGPPAPTYGPPAAQHGPPAPTYGPPAAQHGPPSPQYGTPHSAPGLGPKANHGPPIPLSIEAYGPPTKRPQLPFSGPQKEYGTPHLNHVPQQELSDLYGPPPPPVPGAPAPPTPPEIKYDGWQPIAGHVSGPNQVPENNNYNLPGRDSGQPTLDFNAGIPSDSYGVPLANVEDHNLKTIVSHSSTTAEESGLPPPSLPEFEPLHNAQDNFAFNNVIVDQHQSNIQFAKHNGNSNIQSDLIQPADNYGAPAIETSHTSTIDVQVGGHDDLSLQQLPVAPAATYGTPNDLPVPPPPSDSYGAPPASSYSPNGPYPPSKSHRGPSFSSFNSFNSGFRKHVNHGRNRNNNQYRGPSPPGALIPPRTGPPTKFRDSIPAGLFTNLNSNTSPFPSAMKPNKNYGPPITQDQQLPTLNEPAVFHGSSNSFVSETSVVKNNIPNLSSPLAAPNVNYGTPLSFNNFNAPAPTLTYGAPNFVPPSFFQSTSTGFGDNLYNNFGNEVSMVYGTPVVNAPGTDCVFPKAHSFQYFERNPGHHFDISHQNNFVNQPGHIIHTGPEVLNTNQNQIYETPFNGFNGGELLPPVNELHLEHQEQPRNNLRDSYGNPLDGNYPVQDLTGANTNNIQTAATELADSSVRNQNSFATGSASSSSEGLTSEQLTAALTAQGYGEARHIVRSNEVDASQFLSSQEGSKALSLAQGLTPDGADGFQIQGSQGTYTLQIQSANGGFGTENSDGSIKHEHVLSNGLLQDILAAIEQPHNGQVQIPNIPQVQPLQPGLGDLSQAASSAIDKIEEYDRLQNRADNSSQSVETKTNENVTTEEAPKQVESEITVTPASIPETTKKERSTTRRERQKEARSRFRHIRS